MPYSGARIDQEGFGRVGLLQCNGCHKTWDERVNYEQALAIARVHVKNCESTNSSIVAADSLLLFTLKTNS